MCIRDRVSTQSTWEQQNISSNKKLLKSKILPMLSKIVSSQVQSTVCKTFSTVKNMVTLKVNNREITVPSNTMLIDAITKAGFEVPRLCYHSDIPTSGGICRICLVEDKARPGVPIISCKTLVKPGMNIATSTKVTNELRRTNTSLLFNYHPVQCITCSQAGHCEGRDLCADMKLADSCYSEIMGQKKDKVKEIHGVTSVNNDNSSIVQRYWDLCISCDRCINTCYYLQDIGVFHHITDEFAGHLVGTFGKMVQSECINCGQCINRCPTGALRERDEIEDVMKAIQDPNNIVVFQIAPSIRVGIAEEFGYKPGEKILKNELVEGLKSLGDNVYVVDSNFTADLTIMEEGTELLTRVKEALAPKKKKDNKKKDDHHGHHEVGPLPMFTSCCPGWVLYMEKNHPELLKHLSTAKSPQQMAGSMVKSYWPKKKGIDPKRIRNVAVMPCSAKKYEQHRKEMEVDGIRDVDLALTTRECAKLLKLNNIDISKLKGVDFDHPLGEGTGAGVIFGATGGVMEAALRTAYELITGKQVPFKQLDIHPVRGDEGIKTASIPINKTKKEFAALKGKELKIAVAHDLKNAEKLVQQLIQCQKEGKDFPYHFIEVMACHGGCIGGGGQPKPVNSEVRKGRTSLLYKEDKNLPGRKSHENKEVKAIYKEFLGEPLSATSHKYLHTTYSNKAIDYGKIVDLSQEGEISSFLDSRFPKKRQDLIVEMMVALTDKYNYLSGGGIVCIAKHAGVKPIQVVGTASSYMYIKTEEMGDNIIYACDCLNCQLHGGEEQIARLEKHFGIKMGETTADKKVSLRKAHWLGWCAADAPAVMIKRKGEEQVVPVNGVAKIENLNDLLTMKNKKPAKTFKIEPYTRIDPNGASYLDKVDTKQTFEKALKLGADGIIEEMKKSGLQGRGGAGFPTYIKWTGCKNEKEPIKYVAVNIDEGLPCNYKDWTIISNPELCKKMFTGMCICAYTMKSKKMFAYLRYEYRNEKESMYEIFNEVKAQNSEFKDLELEIRIGGGPYVAGEETALFESIEGKKAFPRSDKNYFPTQRGIFQKPTCINNAETFAAVSIIVAKGGERWGGSASKEGEKGIKLLALMGDIDDSRIMEIKIGTPLSEVLKEVNAQDIVAAECGGTTEPIQQKQNFGKGIGYKTGLPGGSIVLMNSKRDIAQVYKHKMHFMVEESCKQCVPCREGSKILYEAVSNHIKGKKKLQDQPNLMKVASATQTSICWHGKGLDKLYKDAFKYLTK
eukprot:TRINITY_DN135_c0_g1_i2.p1 TRINITY_DN135_c0_g1~~TRINITY_DN135_c0_g1_i2.p1  ORF type:complete len:1240 (-),score=527.54 TRINITY_DN135_c0_g1_i2:126-3845(-)